MHAHACTPVRARIHPKGAARQPLPASTRLSSLTFLTHMHIYDSNYVCSFSIVCIFLFKNIHDFFSITSQIKLLLYFYYSEIRAHQFKISKKSPSKINKMNIQDYSTTNYLRLGNRKIPPIYILYIKLKLLS